MELPYPICVEYKHRQQLPQWLKKAMKQAEADAEQDEIPVAILHEKGSWHDKDIVMVRFNQFEKMLGRL